jgi:hypothetical protein
MTSTHYTPGRRERHPMTTVSRDWGRAELNPRERLDSADPLG